MTPVELSRTVLRAMRRAVDDGELSGLDDLDDVGTAGRVLVERPRPGGCGDYATNVALQVARAAGRSPLQVAEVLSPRLAREPGIAAIDITGPGFLNITLDQSGDKSGKSGSASAGFVRDVLTRGVSYGHVEATGEARQLHFPREVRAAVLADSLRRILVSQGVLARLTCDEAPDPGWGSLGVHLDAQEEPAAQTETLRPVPAPQDPTPLGRDAARWALLYPAAHDRPRIGDEHEHLVQRAANPLFRVRYAHSRTRALTRNAAALGFDSAPGDLAGPEAQALLDALADHPRVLAAAARHRAPDRLARHLVTTADAFLAFKPAVLPLGDEKPSAAHRARLALAEAAGTVLAGGLSLLGISAPEYL
ncbi:DALR anticodon-binding domain-containing protein [Streptomyces durmitorensis]|uniref:arginine--tRNA ligase n=1 Tax=Streptomyces durmitorensis TaxID=319947 RepID=A0ABY4PT70_9ACTN|nr:DALR anticodon-binding domain-containing protein [Streptomyces durmitorensis]UQT56290.1 DALR anticodon-binding domain-containing protein [Streptomyces durmitorensis]